MPTEQELQKIVEEVKAMTPDQLKEELLKLRTRQRVQQRKLESTPPRLMLTVYVNNLEDAQTVFNLLGELKQGDIPTWKCSSIDWDTEWMEAE